MKKHILYSLMMLLSGCASMNKDECQLADWQAVGYQHGARGQNATAFEQYQKDCSKHKIKADFNAFKHGHQLGLNDYCTLEGGVANGRVGANYNNQCPSNRYPNFAKGYRSGLVQYCTYESGYNLGQQGQSANSNCLQVKSADFETGHADGYAKFEVSQAINELENELLALNEKIQMAADHIADAEAVIVSETSVPETRKQALEDIKYYKNEQHQLDYEYHKIEKKLSRLQTRLNRM
ncbi:DUF2799 domain-containing protein [Teredinibacter haidensis]|uniref:DUF2799 domain-containing protein n=1 Tax=Teredinibacter haidensis TaxID=2731755 RepID=UPI000948ECA3|nr:DUF2799 domain-containing protein [Teredinibacter haidensis]